MVDLAWEASPELLTGKRVLELGCGTGRNIPRILAAGAASYTGVDGSSGMLNRAYKHASDSRVHLVRADIRSPIPLPANGFDFILISCVLEHFPEVEDVLSEAARLLAPGGVLRIFELHAESSRSGVGAHFSHEGGEIHLPTHAHDAAEFREALGSNGLEVLRTTDWYAPSAAIPRCPKLAKYRHAFMLELRATTKAASSS
jgi:malonyl-CoA O-methyltransferase